MGEAKETGLRGAQDILIYSVLGVCRLAHWGEALTVVSPTGIHQCNGSGRRVELYGWSSTAKDCPGRYNKTVGTHVAHSNLISLEVLSSSHGGGERNWAEGGPGYPFCSILFWVCVGL